VFESWGKGAGAGHRDDTATIDNGAGTAETAARSKDEKEQFMHKEQRRRQRRQ
jgi:hypothetical protein